VQLDNYIHVNRDSWRERNIDMASRQLLSFVIVLVHNGPILWILCIHYLTVGQICTCTIFQLGFFSLPQKGLGRQISKDVTIELQWSCMVPCIIKTSVCAWIA
jgi:hypothetical protein